MDQDDETASFKANILGSADSVSSTPGLPKGYIQESETEFTSYSAAAEAQGIEISAEDIAEVTGGSPTGNIGRMGGIGARPSRSFLADPNFFTDVKEDKTTRDKISGVLQETSMEEAQELINALGSPKGFEREMIVVGNQVYRILIDDNDKVSFQDLDTPLDGIIMVNEYTPRLIAENGKVKAIELLKQISDDIELDESMTQDLADLSAMFQIEID
ncbi:MAG: hypothetical protein OEZ01_00405 [Candidatus Heimdallarchaeota archaeon]|nr:hypothetical protein [Candidatus Heimdallarchaeota archaeon]MDH5644433.1 hypothetical protein [Candidatus Heimdallarchaeota archaeon]